MRRYRVAIVGATGLVGQETLKVLEQRRFPVGELKLLASERSVGKRMMAFGEELPVEELTARALDRVEIAFFAAGSSISRQFAPLLAQEGALVIDKSDAFRMDPEVPLVVPEVNVEDARTHQGIIASPNCSTIQFVMALHPIHRQNPVKRAIVATYQAVSGTGKEAMEELTFQTEQVLKGKEPPPHVYAHQIAFNVLPQCDVFMDGDITKEEWKLIHETRKILHDEEIAISATCVRVPVLVSHSEAVHLELTNYLSAEDAREILAEAPGVKVLDDPSVSLYPYPWMTAGRDPVFVGRIRQDTALPNGLAMWVVCDNLRKGAALNAVQIAEEVIARGWL